MQRPQPNKGAAKGASKGVSKGAAKGVSKGIGKGNAKGTTKGPSPPTTAPPIRPLGLKSAGTASIKPPSLPASSGSEPLKLKRPGAPAGGTASIKPKTETASSTEVSTRLRVYTKKNEDDIGINTLVGEYDEHSTNHGRKAYKKKEKISGHEEVQVFLFYWDKRDGDGFTGWWFGDQIGGSQVWSRAIDHGETPPAEGWKIPWDGEVEKDLLLVEPLSSSPQRKVPPKAPRLPQTLVKTKSEIVEEAAEEMAPEEEAEEQPEEAEEDPAAAAEEEDVKEEEEALPAVNIVDMADERIVAVESEISEALERVKELVANDKRTEESIKEAEGIVTSHEKIVKDAQQELGQEINQAKIAKESQSVITGLSQLQPRLRTLQATLNGEQQKLKSHKVQHQKKVAEENRRNEEIKKAAQVEQRDAQAFQEALPAATEIVVQAEEAVETVEIMASSVSAELEEDLRDDAASAMEDIEQSAKKAQTALADARKVLAEQIQAARRYSQEARKSALKEYSELQDKVTEAHKKLTPFLGFKKEYEEKIKAKKSMDDISTKLGNAELEVEKAHIMSTTGAQEQMSEEEIKAAEELLQPAQAGLSGAMAIIERKAREPQGAGSTFKMEIERMQGRAKQSREKLEEVRVILRKQREGMLHQQMLSQVHEKVEKAEDALQKTSEAEMPFFKGIEVLPSGEAMQAIAESELSASQADIAIGQARSFVKQKLEAAKRNLSKESGNKIADELGELMARVEQAAQKLVDFKKETSKRKTQNVFQEVVEKVADAEGHAQRLAEITKLFDCQNLDDVTTDKLRATFDQAALVDKDVTESLVEARVTLSRKQGEAKTSAELTKELSKLQERLNIVDADYKKHKKAISGGNVLIKSKQIISSETEKINKQLESEVEKVEQMAARISEEPDPDEAIRTLDSVTRIAVTNLYSYEKGLAKHQADAPAALKNALNKLLARSKKLQEKLDAVKILIRERRESVQANDFVSQAQVKTKEVENALEKVSDAELPFLKGIEVLPLKEAYATVAQSEEALETLGKAIGDARTYLASKKVEIRKFVEKVSKHIEEEFEKCTETINAATQKRTQFTRETEGRRRAAILQEADSQLNSLEEELQKVIDAAEPFAGEDVDKLSPESATEICSNLRDMDKAAQKKSSEVRDFLLNKVQKDVRGDKASEEQLKTCQQRLKDLQAGFTKAKLKATDNEQRYVARRLLSQATDWVNVVEVEVEKAIGAAAPLVDHEGADFLVESQLVTVGLALKDLLKKSSRSKDDLFQELSNGTGVIFKAAFSKYLEEIPAKLERSDLSYTIEQREAMFEYVLGLCKADDKALKAGDIQSDDKREEAKAEEHEGAEAKQATVEDTKTEEAKADEGEGKTEDEQKEAKVEDAKAEAAEVKAEDVKAEDLKVEDVKAEDAKAEDVKAEDVKAEDAKAEKAEEVKAEEVKAEVTNEEQMKKEELKTDAKEATVKHEELKMQAMEGMTLAAFQAMFGLCERFVCVQSVSVTDGFDISKSKTVTKLELDEVVETRGEPITNEVLGVARIECRLLKRNITGWVTMRGNQGTLYLEPFSPYASFLKASERLRQSSMEHSQKVGGLIKAKVADLAECSNGPLSRARLDIVGLKPRIASAQKSLEILVKKMTQAKKRYLRKEEKAKELQQTAKDKKAADIIFAEIKEKVEPMEASIKELKDIVEPIIKMNSSNESETIAAPLSMLDSTEKAAATVVKEYEVVRGCIETHQSKISAAPVIKGPMLELKQEIAKLLIRVEAKKKLCRAHHEVVRKAVAALGSSCLEKATVAIRDQALARELTFEALFSELAGGKDRISEEDFCKYCGALEGLEFPEEHVRLLARHINLDGLGARGFRVMLEQYFECQKRIAITNDFEISKSKTIRMLDIGEAVEVIEGPRGDEKLGVQRVRARALTDSAVGWISVKGNQGTPFLKDINKPCYSCTREVRLEKEFRNISDEGILRTLETEELLEVLEGPRNDTFDEALRIMGKACSDGAVGWLTLKTKEGITNCEKAENKYYVCTAAIAVTDVRDIKSCKVLRKLEVGEVCKVLEGPIDEPESSVTRIHCQSMKDSLGGWITIKGNAGTVYAQEATKHFTVLHNTPLHRLFGSEGAEAIRQLAAGEAFEVLEGPLPEKFDSAVRIKCRAVCDGSIGWVTMKENLRPWDSRHKCTASVVMIDALAGKSSAVLRRIEPGESIVVLDGPFKDPELDVLRVRARAESDGIVGWIPVKGSQGTLYLAPQTT